MNFHSTVAAPRLFRGPSHGFAKEGFMKFRTLRALLVALFATLSVASGVSTVASADEYQAYDDGEACRHQRLHHHGRHQYKYIEGRDPSFNCGCNGSYKYPVPPLYTYHWPGMYSQQLMTDYHSPWRFPPIRPYVDEPQSEPFNVELPKASTSRVRLVPVPR